MTSSPATFTAGTRSQPDTGPRAARRVASPNLPPLSRPWMQAFCSGLTLVSIYGDVAVSAIPVAELHFSVLIARSDSARADRLLRLAVIERTFDALPVDDIVAWEHGRLATAVVAVGRQHRARMVDLLIRRGGGPARRDAVDLPSSRPGRT